MPAHEVEITLPKRELGRADAVFDVKADGPPWALCRYPAELWSGSPLALPTATSWIGLGSTNSCKNTGHEGKRGKPRRTTANENGQLPKQ